MARKEYEVVVGNGGTVYRGTSKVQAIADFREYARRSAKSSGRVAGEDVYLMCDGEILMEHNGYRETGDYDYDDREDNPTANGKGRPQAKTTTEKVPRGFVLLDNGGQSHDRYTILETVSRPLSSRGGGNFHPYLRFSVNPYSSYGKMSYGELNKTAFQNVKSGGYAYFGKRINLSDLAGSGAHMTALAYIQDSAAESKSDRAANPSGRTANPSGPAGIPNAFILLKLHKQPTVDAHGHPIPPRPYSHLLICTFPAYIGHSSYAEWNEYQYLALNPSTGYIEGGRIDEHWMRRYLDGYEKIGKSIGITALPKGSREEAMAFISQQADRIAAWENATPRDQENFARPYHWLRSGGKGR